MWHLSLLLLLVTSTSCSTSSKTGVIASECGKKTDVQLSDLAALGVTPPKDKVVVLRVFASWCPYCKEDFTELGKMFKAQKLTAENSQVILLGYHNRRETKTTFETFMKDTFPTFGIPASAIQAFYIDEDYASLSTRQTSSRKPIFAGWQGVPFTLVFAKDGRLAFRGHFTTSPPLQDSHYNFIHQLTSEICSIAQ